MAKLVRKKKAKRDNFRLRRINTPVLCSLDDFYIDELLQLWQEKDLKEGTPFINDRFPIRRRIFIDRLKFWYRVSFPS